jgi:hypothetical protein
MAIEYTAATGSAVHLLSIVIFSPPFFAAMPWLALRAVGLAAPNGIQIQATWQKGRTVKNGKEAYLECLARCARGLRCRKCGGAAAATDSRNCALCAATSSPGRSRAEERIWSEHRAKENLQWQC